MSDGERKAVYQRPLITEVGSIAAHTFANFNPVGEGDKGTTNCLFCDRFGELSHSNVAPPGQGF
jgi:hypothetical protein